MQVAYCVNRRFRVEASGDVPRTYSPEADVVEAIGHSWLLPWRAGGNGGIRSSRPGYLTRLPLEPVHCGAGPLVCLAGCVPVPQRAGRARLSSREGPVLLLQPGNWRWRTRPRPPSPRSGLWPGHPRLRRACGGHQPVRAPPARILRGATGGSVRPGKSSQLPIGVVDARFAGVRPRRRLVTRQRGRGATAHVTEARVRAAHSP